MRRYAKSGRLPSASMNDMEASAISRCSSSRSFVKCDRGMGGRDSPSRRISGSNVFACIVMEAAIFEEFSSLRFWSNSAR